MESSPGTEVEVEVGPAVRRTPPTRDEAQAAAAPATFATVATVGTVLDTKIENGVAIPL